MGYKMDGTYHYHANYAAKHWDTPWELSWTFLNFHSVFGLATAMTVQYTGWTWQWQGAADMQS